VHRVGLDGRDLDLSQPGGNDILPDVSPDGQQVAYVRDDGSDRAGQTVYVVGTDGRDRQQASSAFPASEIGYAQLVWAPDSKRLALAVSDNALENYAPMSLYVLQPGAAQHRIAHAKAIMSPAWSPDGRMSRSTR
jgi:Tol biopolymer transport system component